MLRTLSLSFLLICCGYAAQPDFPIGRCVKVLNITSPEDAKTVGFDYLELAMQDMLPLSDEEFEKTVTRLRAIGVPAISAYGFMPADVMIAGPDVNQARVDEALRLGLTRAKRLGVQMVVYGNLLGKARSIPAGFSKEEGQKQLIAFGKRAAAEGQKQGIVVLFEPMPASSTNMINTVAEGLALTKAVGHSNFQMLVDYEFMMQGKEDMAILEKAAPHLRQVEISNPNGRVYPKTADEADYASFFRALKAGGYRGGVSIHGAPKNFFEDAPRAIALLRTLTKQ